MGKRLDPEAFGCGHPRTPENSYTAPSSLYAKCRLCCHVRAICAVHRRDQDRLNAGHPLRHVGPVSRYANG